MCYCFNPFIQFSVSQAWLPFTCTKLSILKVLLCDIHIHLSCFKAVAWRWGKMRAREKGWERQKEVCGRRNGVGEKRTAEAALCGGKERKEGRAGEEGHACGKQRDRPE